VRVATKTSDQNAVQHLVSMKDKRFAVRGMMRTMRKRVADRWYRLCHRGDHTTDNQESAATSSLDTRDQHGAEFGASTAVIEPQPTLSTSEADPEAAKAAEMHIRAAAQLEPLEEVLSRPLQEIQPQEASEMPSERI